MNSREELTLQKMIEFINNNLSENEEDKKFMKNLLCLAEVKKDDIEENYKCIIWHINQICEFLQKSENQKNGIREIREMFGFVENNIQFSDDDIDENFYLFVGDLKIKSVAFICRAYSFFKKYANHIQNTDISNRYEKEIREGIALPENIKKIIEERVKLVKESETEKNASKEKKSYVLKEKRLELFDEKDNEVKPETYDLLPENVEEINRQVGEIVNISTEQEISQERLLEVGIVLRDDCRVTDMEEIVNYLTANTLKNKSIRYFLFDNSMREVSFYGVESKFMWLWEQEENIYLFRNVTVKKEDEDLEKKQGEEYMKVLMESIRQHVGGTNIKNAISYSRNPIRDFYKYIDIKKESLALNIQCEVEFSLRNDKLEPKITNCELEIIEDDKAVFEIVKGAMVNSLKVTYNNKTSEIIDFYSYFEKDNVENTKYCIEYCKQNLIVPKTSGRRLKKLEEYLKSWNAIDRGFMGSFISEFDDEVVVSVGYFDNPKKYDDNNTNDYTQDGCYQFELNIMEIIRIMYRLLCWEGDSTNRSDEVKKAIDSKLQTMIDSKIKDMTDELFEEQELNFEDAGVTINIYNSDINSSEISPEQRNDIISTIKEYLKWKVKDKIVEKIMDEIIKTSNKEKQVKTLMVDAIPEDKREYKYARTVAFKYFSENEVLKFWKDIFKSC